MVHSVYLRPCPCTILDVGGLIDIGLSRSVAAEENIVNSVMIAQTCRPLTVCIIVFTVCKVLHIAVGKSIIDIVAYFP